MGFRKLQWLFPLAVTIHNAEEAIWMPGWAARHQLPIQASPGVIRVALLTLTGAAYVVTYLSARRGKQSLWSYLLFGGIVTMLANVFIPHIPASIIFRMYTPGVVTAVAVNLPVMSLLAARALREGWVSGRKAMQFAIAVPAGVAALIALLLAAAGGS
jgi:hypothetical protein